MAKKSIINLMTSMLLVALLPLASCSNDESQGADPVMPPATVSGIEAVTDVFTLGQLDEENETNTRSKFEWDEAQQLYIFSWEKGDHLAIYSTQNVRADYNLITGENSASAKFDGGGFDLTEGATYYGFSHFRVASDETIGNASTNLYNIRLNYNGQVQKGNHNSGHLGAFDYQAAAAVAGAGNYAKMHYKHLGSVVRFFLTLPSDESAESVTFTKLTLTDYNATDPSKKLFNQPMQVLDLTQSKGTAIEDYQPYLESAEITGGVQPAPFSISLRNSENTDGITINKTDNKTLVVHVFIPALELKGQVMKAVLETTKATKKYYITFNATNFIGGKYYNVTRTLIPSGTIDIRLKVNPDWQLGNTQTRAQGDPGYDKGVHAPKYLYPYIVLDGVSDGAEAFHAFGAITTTAKDWTLNADGVYVYNTPLSYSYTGAPTAGRVYAIASDYELTLSASNESDLKGLTYSIPSDKSQDYLRNLYSTPLVTVTSAKVPFTGTVVGFEGGTPSADVTLYHVAAKVDVQWNATAALSTTNSFVSVNDVKNSGLYYFKPTENTPATGTYTVSEPITPGTMYNGRQVFYLPQFAKPTYNIKVGGEVPTTPVEADNVTFTPSITNGWTSWLKANISK